MLWVGVKVRGFEVLGIRVFRILSCKSGFMREEVGEKFSLREVFFSC